MRKLLQSIAVFCLVPLPLLAGPKPPPACQTRADLELRFSPDGGCTKAIVEEIRNAKKQVLVLAYSFTSDPIEQALVDAKERGIDVKAIIDSARVKERSSGARTLDNHAIEVYSDAAHSIQHQKVMIIDPEESTATIILGSFNFTKSAESSNSENIVIIRSRDVARSFAENWELHKKHSKRYDQSTGEYTTFQVIQYMLITLLAVVITWKVFNSKKAAGHG